ncbi:MAG: putative inorganic carbon transporter subunit DabA [Sandaracinaceae bacterium]
MRGGFVAITGVASALPLVARTLAPGLSDRLARIGRSVLSPEVVTRLELTREVGVDRSEDGLFEGYTWDEQASIVENVLSSIGLTDGFAELVLIAGHGSSSVNNPHAAAYNCGACAGGKGGPNARAFAAMANHPEVRTRLAKRGLTLPDGTHFLGCEHDTATDAFAWYDEGAIPEEPARARGGGAALAGRRSASTHTSVAAGASLTRARHDPSSGARHAAARTVDPAQTRPEYCHATNALAVIGRRLTRGLFLDRRLPVSWPIPPRTTRRDIGSRSSSDRSPLVGAGINPEYYFSRVDQDRYGCGTKLPHNITGLLGVMNGHGSDLRTGLHWQTVEIHEPVRLLTVVESTPEILLAIADRHEGVRRLVTHRWLLLATVHPETGEVSFFGPGGFEKHAPSTERLTHAESSRALYGGHRDHLPFALIHPTELHR